MSISGIAGTALSGMRAQTTRIGAIANNVANSSTPGYARLNTSLTSVASGGVQATVSPTASDVDLASRSARSGPIKGAWPRARFVSLPLV
jgi:flagellar basal-body rod protein FlgC